MKSNIGTMLSLWMVGLFVMMHERNWKHTFEIYLKNSTNVEIHVALLSTNDDNDYMANQKGNTSTNKNTSVIKVESEEQKQITSVEQTAISTGPPTAAAAAAASNDTDTYRSAKETAELNATSKQEQTLSIQPVSEATTTSSSSKNATTTSNSSHLLLQATTNKTEPTTSNKMNDEWLKSCVSELENQPRYPFSRNERPQYAIGDCIKMCNKCEWDRGFYYPHQQQQHRKHVYPNWTIAGVYGGLACPETNPRYVTEGNLTLVNQVLEQFAQQQQQQQGSDSDGRFHKPDPNAIVLHLRLGDVIEHSPDDVFKMLAKGGKPWPSFGHNSIKSVYEYLDNIEESNSTQVILIGGSHKPKKYKKSRVYAGCLERALTYAGKNVTVQIDGGDADQDFYFMSFAKKVVVSVGGFSRLIGQMVEFNGGKVYGRQFDTSNEIRKFEQRRDRANKKNEAVQ